MAVQQQVAAPGLLAPRVPVRRVSWLERLIGPDYYKVVRGLLVTPTSVVGLIIMAVFILIALGAPVIAPASNPDNPYKMPRDGFSSDPRPPMTEWTRLPPSLPFWYQPVMHSDKWVHL